MGLSKEQVKDHITSLKGRLDEKEQKYHGYEFAKLCFQVKEYESAIRYLKDYLTVKGDDYRAQKWMGRLYEIVGNNVGAVLHYEKSLELKHNQRDVVFKVAELHLKNDRPPRGAIGKYLNAVKKLSDSHPLIFLLAQKEQTLSGLPMKDSDVENFYKEHLCVRSDNPLPLVQLVQHYLGLEKIQQAFDCCQLFNQRTELQDCVPWQKCFLQTAEKYYEYLQASGNADVYLILDSLIAILKCTGVTFRLQLKGHCGKVLKSSTELLCLLIKFDHVLCYTCKVLRGILTKPKITYHMVIRELCGQLYAMAAQYLYIKGEGVRFYAPPYTVEVQLGNLCLLTSLKATCPHLDASCSSENVGLQIKDWYNASCVRLSTVGWQVMVVASFRGKIYFEEIMKEVKAKNDKLILIKSLFDGCSALKVPCGMKVIQYNLQQSFLANDDSFLNVPKNLPLVDDLAVCDKEYVIGCKFDLGRLVWLSLAQKAVGLLPPISDWVMEMFPQLNLSTPDLSRNDADSLCRCDLEAFLVLQYHKYEKFLSTGLDTKQELNSVFARHFSPYFFDIEENDIVWWKEVTKYLEKKYSSVAEGISQKKIVQDCVNTVRGYCPIRLDMDQLIILARHFKIQSEKIGSLSGDDSYNLQSVAVTMLQWSCHYWTVISEAISDHQRRKRKKDHRKSSSFSVDKESILAEAQLTLANAALSNNDAIQALRHFSQVNTPQAAWNQSQIYILMADQEDVDSHARVSYLQKASDFLANAIGQLSSSNDDELRDKISSKQEEVKQLLSKSFTGLSLEYEERGPPSPQLYSTPTQTKYSPGKIIKHDDQSFLGRSFIDDLKEKEKKITDLSHQLFDLQTEIKNLKKKYDSVHELSGPGPEDSKHSEFSLLSDVESDVLLNFTSQSKTATQESVAVTLSSSSNDVMQPLSDRFPDWSGLPSLAGVSIASSTAPFAFKTATAISPPGPPGSFNVFTVSNPFSTVSANNFTFGFTSSLSGTTSSSLVPFGFQSFSQAVTSFASTFQPASTMSSLHMSTLDNAQSTLSASKVSPEVQPFFRFGSSAISNPNTFSFSTTATVASVAGLFSLPKTALFSPSTIGVTTANTSSTTQGLPFVHTSIASTSSFKSDLFTSFSIGAPRFSTTSVTLQSQAGHSAASTSSSVRNPLSSVTPILFQPSGTTLKNANQPILFQPSGTTLKNADQPLTSLASTSSSISGRPFSQLNMGTNAAVNFPTAATLFPSSTTSTFTQSLSDHSVIVASASSSVSNEFLPFSSVTPLPFQPSVILKNADQPLTSLASTSSSISGRPFSQLNMGTNAAVNFPTAATLFPSSTTSTFKLSQTDFNFPPSSVASFSLFKPGSLPPSSVDNAAISFPASNQSMVSGPLFKQSFSSTLSAAESVSNIDLETKNTLVPSMNREPSLGVYTTAFTSTPGLLSTTSKTSPLLSSLLSGPNAAETTSSASATMFLPNLKVLSDSSPVTSGITDGEEHVEDEVSSISLNRSDDNLNFVPIVSLPEVEDFKSGEEDEELLFCHRAKLRRFHNNEWKERGLGDIKILKHLHSKKVRLLMRREQILKICCNHYISPNTTLKPIKGTTNSYAWYAVNDISDGAPKNEMFAIRFKQLETANTFKNTIEKCVEELKKLASTDSLKQQGVLHTDHSLTACKSKKPTISSLTTTSSKLPELDSSVVSSTTISSPSFSTLNVSGNEKNLSSQPHEVIVESDESSLSTVTNSNLMLLQTPSGSWRCETCYVVNATTDTSCIACSAEKSSSGEVLQRINMPTESNDSTFKASICSPAAKENTDSTFKADIFSPHIESTDSILAPSKTSNGKLLSFPLTVSSFDSNPLHFPVNTTQHTQDISSLQFPLHTTESNLNESKLSLDPTVSSEEVIEVTASGKISVCPSSLEKDRHLASVDDSVVFLYEELPEQELINKASEFMLPPCFYLYEKKPPCPGCRGCSDEFETDMLSAVNKVSEVSQTNSLLPTSKSNTVDKQGYFSSVGMLSFSDITSKSAGSFNKSKGFQFQGTGSQVFSSRQDVEGDNPEEEADVEFEPIVTLPESYTSKSWDDNAEVLFTHRSKLFRFDSGSKQWKERGVGDIKILKHKETKKVRVIMRRDQILKICCNHYITKDMKLMPGINEKSWIWFTHCDYSDETPKEEKMAVKFRHAETATKFKQVFEDCVHELEQVTVTNVNRNALATVPLSLPKAGWGCECCMVVNNLQDTNCVACSAPRPGSTVL